MQAIEPSAIAAAVPVGPRPPRTWYFLGSTLFGLGVHAVQILVAAVVTFLMLVERNLPPPASFAETQAQLGPGWPSITLIATSPFMLAALWVPIRIARRGFAEYLALQRWPSRGELARAIAWTFAVLLVWSLVGTSAGVKTPSSMLASYRSIRDAGLLPLHVIALCIAAPVTEEFLFRGFLFQGWSQSFLKPVGTILLTAVLWTSLHIQYDWFYQSQIFAVGLVLGYWRYRSGSTWLATMGHAFMNVVSVVETALVVAYLA